MRTSPVLRENRPFGPILGDALNRHGQAKTGAAMAFDQLGNGRLVDVARGSKAALRPTLPRQEAREPGSGVHPVIMARGLFESQAHCHVSACKTFGMDASELAHRRALLVVESFAAEHGRGWQAELSKITGIHQTTLSKLKRSSRDAGTTVIGALISKLKIKPAFFYDPLLGDSPDYQQHSDLESRVESSLVSAEVLARLSSMLVPAPTAQEIRWATSMPYCNWTVESLYQVIEGARRGMSPEQVSAMDAETARYAAKP